MTDDAPAADAPAPAPGPTAGPPAGPDPGAGDVAGLLALAGHDPAAAARAATAWCAGTLAERTGTEFTAVGPEEVAARMPVAGNTQPMGLLHGGASAALAETVGSVLCSLAAGPGTAAVGVDLSATHHRGVTPARSTWVTATARPLHVGRRVATVEVVVVDDDGRRVCTARLTCQLVAATSG
ncbi:PaaI family thioesterase [uncultured Pseudokineococcus sp.]|uniref:PaaI family thioesterase n=1 Tax=uncultured Pseudokineococcus sp. TaxID=1642928 RepID=UPI002606A070|nr:hotdog fold thioesterase [uncultured Pseudokineococcus sp.]